MEMTTRTTALLACTAAFMLAMPGAALAQKAKLVEFSGDARTAPADIVTTGKLDALKGTRAVIIPQFTVEYVLQSDGLSDKEEKKQDYVRVDYRVDAPEDAQLQALTDRLYAYWTAGLQKQGLTVLGPQDAAAKPSWSKIAAKAKRAPATIQRDSGVLMLYSVSGSGFLMPLGAKEGPPTGTAATISQAADTGAVVADKAGGRFGKMFGMARGVAKLGSGVKGFSGAWEYAGTEPKLAREAGAAVMTVRLVVGLRDTDMASRGFGAFRSAGSYDGKPKLVVQSEGTAVNIVPPGDGSRRAEIGLKRDLVFAENLFGGRIEAANGTGRTLTNMMNRGRFIATAIGGGSASIDQRHTFVASADPAAYLGAVERNLTAVQDILLQHAAKAW
jgi:hypothetical protein